MYYDFPVPNTFDKIMIFAGIFVVSFIALIGIIFLLKKMKNKGK